LQVPVLGRGQVLVLSQGIRTHCEARFQHNAGKGDAKGPSQAVEQAAQANPRRT
jgi:hypothetical protein